MNAQPKHTHSTRFIAKLVASDDLTIATQHLPCKIIRKDGKPYLERYFQEQHSDGTQIWLHHILKPDPEELWHSHPWVAHSEILSGGYTEERYYNGHNKPFVIEYTCQQGETNFITPTCIHRIASVQPNTWTRITITPNRAKTWFFIDMQGNKTPIQTSPSDWWQYQMTRSGSQPIITLR